METRQITVSFDKQLIDTAERIFDDIGLNFQSASTVFLKRVVKEAGISFLLQNAPAPIFARSLVQEVDDLVEEDVSRVSRNTAYSEDSYSVASRRSNNEITEEMRDHIWEVFTKNKSVSYSDYQELARQVSKETGMNQGSAYIYFIILSCFVEGKFNTRTMKFADLVYYVKRILQEYTKTEFISTIKSLESSVPYWAEKIPGRFSEKVQSLVNQYKPLLASMPKAVEVVTEVKKPTMYSKAGFEKWLIAAGYKQYTSSGHPSTVYDYLKRIDKVCDIEGITWSELPSIIGRLVCDYDVGGSKEDIGAESHNAVISALKRASEYIKQR